MLSFPVRDELLRSHSALPSWVRVEIVQNISKTKQFARIVDLGEAEAIELALELHADRLLIDERKGRRLAVQEGIPVIGLLGVILLARRHNIIPSARALLDRIEREAGMYLDRDLKETALKKVHE